MCCTVLDFWPSATWPISEITHFLSVTISVTVNVKAHVKLYVKLSKDTVVRNVSAVTTFSDFSDLCHGFGCCIHFETSEKVFMNKIYC